MRYFLSSFIFVKLVFEMKKLLLLASIILLTTLSCRQVYWQRNKVRSSGKQLNYSIAVEIKNTVPEIFNPNFNQSLKENCEKEFLRMGYKLTYKDKPDYLATITISMDTFSINGTYTFGQGPRTIWQTYKRDKVKAILFDYQIFNIKLARTKWLEQNDIYYFDDVDRNAKRSINMIKYTIRYGK